MRLPAVGPIVEPDLRDILLALLLEEALWGLDPDGAGRGINAVEAFAEQLLVELARREGRAGECGELFDRVLDLTANASEAFIAFARCSLGLANRHDATSS